LDITIDNIDVIAEPRSVLTGAVPKLLLRTLRLAMQRKAAILFGCCLWTWMVMGWLVLSSPGGADASIFDPRHPKIRSFSEDRLYEVDVGLTGINGRVACFGDFNSDS
jgi:hypothetical protein